MSANKAFYTLFATFGIALVGLTTLLIKSLPLTIAHAIYFCQKTFSSSIILPHSLHSIFVFLAGLIFVVGFFTLLVHVFKTRLYLRSKQLVDIKRNIRQRAMIPKAIKRITSGLGLESKIDIIKDNNQFSFCYGIIKPRICLSTSLVKKLTPNELKAVLLHESYHLKSHDPLKILVGQAASHMFFFLPVLGDVYKYYALSKEIAADGVAIKMGQKESLLSALSKLINLNNPRFSGVAALASTNDLEKRIRVLTRTQDKILFRPSLLNVSLSLIVLLFSFIILNAPVHAIGMDDQSMGNSYCVCPYDDRCSKDCQTNFSSKEITFSENEHSSSTNRLYTPVEDQIK